MNPIVRNILAVVAGIAVGMLVNGGIINVGEFIIPPPDGYDGSTMEGIKASMHLLKPKDFSIPFLAHALGTLVGALVAAKIAVSHKMKFALGIGAFFLIAGTIMVFLLPSPAWFNVLDVVGAYIPMAYLGGRITSRE